MKKIDKSDSSTIADVLPLSQPIVKPNVIHRLEDVMLQLGEVHNMLARTPLSKDFYQPISSKFAIAKVELFNIYNELKNEITCSENQAT